MRKGEYRVSSVEIFLSYPTRKIDNISTVYMHMLRITGFRATTVWLVRSTNNTTSEPDAKGNNRGPVDTRSHFATRGISETPVRTASILDLNTIQLHFERGWAGARRSLVLYRGGNSKNVSLTACCNSSCPRGPLLRTETWPLGFPFVAHNICLYNPCSLLFHRALKPSRAPQHLVEILHRAHLGHV